MISPSGSIKKLEDNLRFSDTFQNRVSLDDAYLRNRQYEKAIELYESSLTGVFSENEYALAQLAIAYYEVRKYDEVITTANKLYTRPQFNRSKVHVYYAVSLAATGMIEKAEQEFKKMNIQFSCFEARYYYSQFLISNQRQQEGLDILLNIQDEFPRLTPVEKRENREWYTKAKDYLNHIRQASQTK